MPALSRRQRIDRLRARLISSERWVDALLVVKDHSGAEVFRVGGCWDRHLRCYVDRPGTERVIVLKKSQHEMGYAIGRYLRQRLANDDSRVALMMAIGNRGGGKTWLLALFLVALALALPGSWQMGVSITAKQNREIKTAIQDICGDGWVSVDVTDFRDPHTDFVTRSQILWHTSKNWKALRQALLPFENVFINEGQDQREEVYRNSISAIRSGGLVTVATNPPQDLTGAGDWVAVLYQGIEADLEAGVHDGAAFVLDAADNDAVSQPTLGKIERLLRLVNESAADADSLGMIKLAGSIAYQGFTRRPRIDGPGGWQSGHIGDPPDDWTDETRKITAEATETAGYDYVGGSDFQAEPGCCAAVGKLYRTKHHELVLWIRHFIATIGVEEDLTRALNARGYYPGPVDYDGNTASSLLLVGDATGARQNAEHRKRTPYSFRRLQADGWMVLPPYWHRNQKGGRTEMNPLVEDSRKQMKGAFLCGAIVISPACKIAPEGFPSLIESLARAKVTSSGKFEKARHDHFTHGPDGVRYLAWRFLPRAQPAPAPAPEFNRGAFDAFGGLQIVK